jgi:hypothetical protein
MRRTTICALMVIVLLAAVVILAGEAWAVAGACPEWMAERDVREARTALRKAERRLAETQRVLTATRTYSARYGASVSRWVRLSRRVGWGWAQLPTLMYVVDRESGGSITATNPYSGTAGLLQIHPCHGLGDAAYDPRANLAYGLKLFRGAGWSPWAL